MKEDYESKMAEIGKQGSAAGVLAEEKLSSEKEANLAKIKAMEEKVAEAEAANQKTQDQMNELGNVVSAAAKSAPAMLRAAKDSLEAKQLRVDELESSIVQLRKEHATYKTYYDGLDETSKGWDEEKKVSASLRDEVAELEKSVNSLEATVTTLTTEVKQSVSAKDMAENEKNAASSKLDATIEEDQKQIKLLEATIAERDATIQGLNNDIATANDTLEKANSDYVENISVARGELSAQLATETARANSAEAEITQVTTQMTELQARLEKEVAAMDATIKQDAVIKQELQDTIDGKARDGSDIGAELEKAKLKIDEMQIKIDQQAADMEEIGISKKGVEDTLTSESTRMTNEINVLTNTVEGLNDTVARRSSEVEKLNADLNAVRQQLDEKSTEFSDLKIANEGVFTERDALQLQLDVNKEENGKQLENIKETYAASREKLEAQQADKLAQLDETMKQMTASGEAQLTDMVAQRKDQELKNAELQTALTLAHRKDTQNGETILSLKQDLQGATQTLTKNIDQFQQLSSDLEAAGKLNEQLQKDLELQKQAWDEDVQQMTTKREELAAAIAALEQSVADKQAQIAAQRDENVAKVQEAETARLAESEANKIIEERDGTIASMKEQAAAAEQLRAEMRGQHQADLDSGSAEREELETKVAGLTKDLSTAQAQVDETRKDLVQSRQDYSEEKVTRESRDTEIAALNLEVGRQKESLDKKDEQMSHGSTKTTETLASCAAELAASQKLNEELQAKLSSADEDNEKAMMDISSWKAREAVAKGKADEGWAKAESEAGRADGCDQGKLRAEEALASAMAEWKADAATKEAEKEALMVKDAALMGELEAVRTTMQEESNARSQAQDAQAAAEASLATATEALDSNSAGLKALESQFADQSSSLADTSASLSKSTQEAEEKVAALQASVESLTAELTATKTDLTSTTGAKDTAEQAQATAEQAQRDAEAAKSAAEAHRDECLQNLEDTRKELADKTQEMTGFAKDAQAKQTQLAKDLDAMTTKAGGGSTDLDNLTAKFDALTQQNAETVAANTAGTARIKELEDWQTDAQVQQAAAAKQLEDTKEQLAKEITNIKEEQANAQAAMEVAQTKFTEAQSSLMAAQNEAKQANDARQAAVEELKISQGDSDAKAAKLDNLTAELAAKSASETAASAAKKEARDAASGLNDEVGLLRSQLTASSRKEQASTASYNETAGRLNQMEALNIENGQIMSEMTKSFTSSQAANKELKDALNKLMDVVRKAESEAKAATDAVKSGKQPAPVLATMRQEANELNEAIQEAAKTFDPAAGQFNPVDLKSSVERGSIGNASASMPAGKSAPTARAPQASIAAGIAPAAASAGGYQMLEGTLEKMGGGKTGRGANYKKRHFRLGKSTLTYCASAKQDAKVLGVIQLSGGGVRMDGVNVIITDAGGREYELRAKTAPEAKKWAGSVQNNVSLSADEDDDE
jgi:chromosome segregation ATPase